MLQKYKKHIIVIIFFYISFNSSFSQSMEHINNDVIKTKSEFSWFTYLSENFSNQKDYLPWIQEFELKENIDLFDQIGGTYYELYGGKFRHIDEIKTSLVKKYIPQTAEVIFKKTKIGKRIDTLSQKIVSYFRVEYIKRDDYKDAQLYFPGETTKQDEVTGLYGFTLSSHIANENDYIFKLNAFYTDSIIVASYEPLKKEFIFSFTDIRLELFHNGKTKIEFISTENETNGTLTIFFPF